LSKIIPLNARRSSTRGVPWPLGKKHWRRAICASVSQKRLLNNAKIVSFDVRFSNAAG